MNISSKLIAAGLMAGTLAMAPAPIEAKNGKSTAGSASYTAKAQGTKYKTATTNRKATKQPRIKNSQLSNTTISRGMQVQFRQTGAQKREAALTKRMQNMKGGGSPVVATRPGLLSRIGSFFARLNPMNLFRSSASATKQRTASVELPKLTRDANGKLVDYKDWAKTIPAS